MAAPDPKPAPAPEPHDCNHHAVPILTGGPLGHGWACDYCGALLQVG